MPESIKSAIIDKDMRDKKIALTQLKDILKQIDDLASDAEEIVNKHFKEFSVKADSYGVFQLGWSSNPYDTTLSTIVEEIEDELEVAFEPAE